MNTPDNWIILKVTTIDKPFFKVLCGWSGGYLDGDTWQLNSGITKIEEDSDYYLFHGYSGSIYKCHKESETVRANISGVLSQLLERFPDKIELINLSDVDMDIEEHIPEKEIHVTSKPIIDDNF